MVDIEHIGKNAWGRTREEKELLGEKEKNYKGLKKTNNMISYIKGMEINYRLRILVVNTNKIPYDLITS